MSDVQDILRRHREIIADTKAPPAASSSPSPVAGILAKYRTPVEPPGEPPTEEAAPSTSGLEALGRGALQGATLGFADEVAGALESAFTSKTYKQARDESRAAFKGAQESHPWLYGAGELGGGVATSLIPVGAAAKAVGLGAKAVQAARGAGGVAHAIETGAALGGVSALGASEAEDFGDQIADAVKGAATGGVTAGVLSPLLGKLVRGAPARDAQRTLAEVADKALPTTRAKIAQSSESVLDTIKEHGLRKVAKDPEKLSAAVRTAVDHLGERTDEIYATADSIAGGVPLTKILPAMHKVEKEFARNPATKNLARKIAAQIEDARATWRTEGAPGSVDLIPATEVRSFATALQTAVAGAEIHPTVAKRAGRQVATAVRDVLNEYVDDIARTRPQTREIGAMLRELPRLNRQTHALLLIEEAAKKRAQVGQFTTTGLRDVGKNMLNVGAGAASLATGSPLPLIGSLALQKGVPSAARGTDRALTALVEAAQAGNPRARVLLEGLQRTPALAGRLAGQGMGTEAEE